MTEKRTQAYRKDQEIEKRLEKFNRIIEPLELELISGFDEPKKPTLFIIGAPRSATTLIHQLIAKIGYFGYISNFLARFWNAPYFGALQERAFEIRGKHQTSYESDYGRTKGWQEPHQFNYFWRKWFQFDENHQMKQDLIEKIDIKLFRQEIAALEDVFQKPVAFRSLYCGMQIPFLKKALKQAKFVICTRNPLYQAQSILIGRKAFFGNFRGWFSLKPKEYSGLKMKNEYEQVAGQIYYILKAIVAGLKQVDRSDYAVLRLEDLVSNPTKEMAKILRLVDIESSKELEGLPDNFEVRNVQKINEKEWQLLEAAVKGFFGEEMKSNSLIRF